MVPSTNKASVAVASDGAGKLYGNGICWNPEGFFYYCVREFIVG
jgi:hypothetical protein